MLFFPLEKNQLGLTSKREHAVFDLTTTVQPKTRKPKNQNQALTQVGSLIEQRKSIRSTSLAGDGLTSLSKCGATSALCGVSMTPTDVMVMDTGLTIPVILLKKKPKTPLISHQINNIPFLRNC